MFPRWQKKWGAMRTKFRKWLIFSVVLALLPLAFAFLLALGSEGPRPILPHLVDDGELLLLAVGLSTAALGNALYFQDSMQVRRDWMVGVCAINLALASFLFAVVSVGNASGTDVGYAVVVSLVLYVSAVITSGVCATLTGR